MFDLTVAPWELVVRATAIYIALVAALRIFGKREVGQFTLIDLVLILLVANAVQPAMTGPDTSLAGGLIIIVTLVVENRLIAWSRARFPFVQRLLESPPTVLARDGQWIAEALESQELSIEDVEMALREHGLKEVSEVELAILEADGVISVVPYDRALVRSRRRMRFVHRS
jgi:uncharacterized membrane protein YcaP (DUF421 family)